MAVIEEPLHQLGEFAAGALLGGGTVLLGLCVAFAGLRWWRRRQSQLSPSHVADPEHTKPIDDTQHARNPARDQRPASNHTEPTTAGIETLLTRMPMPAYLKDSNGVYRLANAAFSDCFEVDSSKVVGATDRDILPSDLATLIIAGDREVLRDGKPATEALAISLPSGTERSIDLIRFTLMQGEGSACLAGIVVDTTAHTLAKRELRESQRQAELGNRSKSEFLANMSHELRTPLNAIIGFSEIIKTEMLGPIGQPSYIEYGTDINESAMHLLGLINDILDLSKIEAGSEELAEETVTIPDLVDAVIMLVKTRAHNSGIKLVTETPDDPPVLIADKRKVKQVLVNLLTNAIKFTPKGGQVILRTAGDDRTGDLMFQVIDTGVGMAEEDIPRALNPFSQLDRQLSRKHEGTGLGLPLAKRMVEMHFGTLAIVSAIGEGTTITVRFPATRVSWPEQQVSDPEPAQAASVFGNS